MDIEQDRIESLEREFHMRVCDSSCVGFSRFMDKRYKQPKVKAPPGISFPQRARMEIEEIRGKKRKEKEES